MTFPFRFLISACALLGGLAVPFSSAAPPELARQEANTWVKRSPLPDGPVSPRLGYESSLGFDP